MNCFVRNYSNIYFLGLLMIVKENYNFFGGEGKPRKQHLPWQPRVFPWRLLTIKKTNLLGGRNIFLSLWWIKYGTSFLGGQPLRKSSLSAKTANEINFSYLLSLSEFAQRFVAKDHFLGGLSPSVLSTQDNSGLW
jgi:hypothetical protein